MNVLPNCVMSMGMRCESKEKFQFCIKQKSWMFQKSCAGTSYQYPFSKENTQVQTVIVEHSLKIENFLPFA